jgi:hypothetical protein
MRAKLNRHSRRHILLALIAILLVATTACGDGDKGAVATQPPAAQPTQAAAGQVTSAVQDAAPTAEPPTPTAVAAAVEPTATTAPVAEEQPTPTPEPVAEEAPVLDATPLDTYRAVSVNREGGQDGTLLIQQTIEWDAATPAYRIHHVLENGGEMEEIFYVDTKWTKMGSRPPIKQTVAPENDQWFNLMPLVQHWGITDESDLPEDIKLVPGQIFPVAIKKLMVFAGEEEVNGIRCRRYTVDGDFAYSQDLPAVGMTDYSGHATGEIWIAAQSGIPSVIIRARMQQSLTTSRPDGETQTNPYWEHDILDINAPITIEPPE